MTACSISLRSSKIYVRDRTLSMASNLFPVSAEDDPRHSSYPCFGSHKAGKLRTNQYAQWTCCGKCGLRLSYGRRGDGHGMDRQIGPDPALTLQAVQELQLTNPPDQCTDKIFNGKLMELQGKRMQTGQTTTMAVNQGVQKYEERTGNVTSPAKAYPKMASMPKALGTPAIPAATALDHTMVAEEIQALELRAQQAINEEKSRSENLAMENAALHRQVLMAKQMVMDANSKNQELTEQNAAQQTKIDDQQKALASTSTPKKESQQLKLDAAQKTPVPEEQVDPLSPATVLSVPDSEEDSPSSKKRSKGDQSSLSGVA